VSLGTEGDGRPRDRLRQAARFAKRSRVTRHGTCRGTGTGERPVCRQNRPFADNKASVNAQEPGKILASPQNTTMIRLDPAHGERLGGRGRLLTLVVAAVVAAAAAVALSVVLAPSARVFPSFGCAGTTPLAAVPDTDDPAAGPRDVAANGHVLVYDPRPRPLSRPTVLQDPLRLTRDGEGEDASPMGFDRHELAPGLIEIVPRGLEPSKVYTLEWQSAHDGVWRPESHFHVRPTRDDQAPRIGAIGPAEIFRTRTEPGCHSHELHLSVPFQIEDESPVVVGVWEGARAEGPPLGWTAPWLALGLDLADDHRLTMLTFVVFDTSGNRSAPCSLHVDVSGPPPEPLFGCGKSSIIAKEKKVCTPPAPDR
jgi:hypothetical protein